MIFKEIHFATWFAVAIVFGIAHCSRHRYDRLRTRHRFVVLYLSIDTDPDTCTTIHLQFASRRVGEQVVCAWCNWIEAFCLFIDSDCALHWLFRWNQSTKIDTCHRVVWPRLSAMCASSHDNSKNSLRAKNRSPSEYCSLCEINSSATHATTRWHFLEVRFNETVSFYRHHRMLAWFCVKIKIIRMHEATSNERKFDDAQPIEKRRKQKVVDK